MQPLVEFVPFPEVPLADGYISAPAETDVARLRRESELERHCGNTMMLFSEEAQNTHVTVAEQLTFLKANVREIPPTEKRAHSLYEIQTDQLDARGNPKSVRIRKKLYESLMQGDQDLQVVPENWVRANGDEKSYVKRGILEITNEAFRPVPTEIDPRQVPALDLQDLRHAKDYRVHSFEQAWASLNKPITQMGVGEYAVTRTMELSTVQPGEESDEAHPVAEVVDLMHYKQAQTEKREQRRYGMRTRIARVAAALVTLFAGIATPSSPGNDRADASGAQVSSLLPQTAPHTSVLSPESPVVLRKQRAMATTLRAWQLDHPAQADQAPQLIANFAALHRKQQEAMVAIERGLAEGGYYRHSDQWLPKPLTQFYQNAELF